MPRGKTTLTYQREEAIYNWAHLHHPVTVRQLFYRLVTLDLCDKTEKGYKAIARIAANMRKDDELPWSYIADNTRWMRKPTSYDTMADALEEMQQYYRKNLWGDQSHYCEIWIEKEALSGVILPVTTRWDVPLMVSKGFASLSYLYEAAETFDDQATKEKQSHIFFFGDYDPSGIAIRNDIQNKIEQYTRYADVHFHNVAVNPEQIQAWNLPTRPTKRTDTRAKDWEGDSVELDAIEPPRLRELVEQSITRCINHEQFEKTKEVELAEKETLETYLQSYNGTSPILDF